MLYRICDGDCGVYLCRKTGRRAKSFEGPATGGGQWESVVVQFYTGSSDLSPSLSVLSLFLVCEHVLDEHQWVCC
jgi:hypothetical protein